MFKRFGIKIRIIIIFLLSLVSIIAISFLFSISIDSVKNFGQFSVRANTDSIRKISLNYLVKNTQENANRYSEIFSKAETFSDILADSFKHVHATCDVKIDVESTYENVEYFPSFKAFTSRDKFGVGAYYKSNKKELPTQIRSEINALAYLDKTLIKIKGSSYYRNIWVKTASGISLRYPAIDTKRQDYFSLHQLESTFESEKGISFFIKGVEGRWTKLYMAPDGTFNLSIITKVYNRQNKYLGVVGIDINLRSLLKSSILPLNNSKINGIDRHLMSAIIDETGNVIVYDKRTLSFLGLKKPLNLKNSFKVFRINLNSSQNPQIRDVVGKIFKLDHGITELSIKGKKYYFTFSNIESTNWNYVTLMPESVLYASILQTKKKLQAIEKSMIDRFVETIVIAILLIVLVTIVLMLILNYYLLNPIQALLNGMKVISSGDLKHRIKLPRGKELKEMANTFNSMANDLFFSQEKLKAHEDHLEKLVELRTNELINANKQLEIEKEKAQNATQSKSEFLVNMNHEFRTPMNAILAYTDLISKESDDNELLERLSIIKSSGQSLLKLTDDILDLSRAETGRMDLQFLSVDLKSFLKDINNLFMVDAKRKNLDFLCFVENNDNRIFVFDKDRVKQVLVNLVGNAIKFTKHGYIRVNVSIKEKRGKAEIVFTVDDSGTGINKSEKPLVFEPFHQLDNQTLDSKGTGLGLSISKNLASLMGGELSIVDKKTPGTLFQFILRNIEIVGQVVEREIEKIEVERKESPKKKFAKLEVDKKIIAEWESVRDKFIINEIKDFGEKMHRYAQKNNSEALTLWSKNVMNAVEKLDIFNLKESINSFISLVVEKK